MSDASKIETNGVHPVPNNERYGRPFDLFPVWFSWNFSIFGIPLGIYDFGLGLSVWPAMLAGVIGYFLSCALVGSLAVGSVRTGLPTLVQSRLAFGYHGNKLPTFFGYLANMGWKVTLLSMATTTLADLVANLVPGLLNAKGMPVGVCGEAAADPDLAVVLAGLGVNSLSMTPVALDDVRASLAEVTFEEAQARAEAALNGDFYHPAN